MRNYRTLDEAEFRELERLYPTTTNRELSKRFNISVDAIQDRFAKVHGYIVERGGNTIYFNEQTKRSPQMEANAPLYGLKIKEYGE